MVAELSSEACTSQEPFGMRLARTDPWGARPGRPKERAGKLVSDVRGGEDADLNWLPVSDHFGLRRASILRRRPPASRSRPVQTAVRLGSLTADARAFTLGGRAPDQGEPVAVARNQGVHPIGQPVDQR